MWPLSATGLLFTVKRVNNNSNESNHLPNSLGKFFVKFNPSSEKKPSVKKLLSWKKKKEVKQTYVRSRQDSNLRGETPMDF